MTQEEFEQRIVPMLLKGELQDLHILREQYSRASIQKRDWTGTGVFVYFTVPENSPRTAQKHITLGDIRLILRDGIPADAILHIKDGLLEALECLRYDSKEWPREPQIQTLDYHGSNERDPEYLRSQLSA